MEDEETNIFSGVVFETIEAVALGLGIGLGQVGVEGQSVVGRRELKKRMKKRELLGHERYMNFDIRNVTQRRLPSGSSAVDVSMVITGKRGHKGYYS